MRKVKPAKPKKKSGKVKKFLIRFLVIVVILILGAGGYGYYSLMPTGDGSNDIAFEITEGQSLSDVLDNLQAENLIKSSTIAQLYGRVTGHNEYYFGTFNLNDGMGTIDILNHIGDIDNALVDQISITVPEGTWAKEVAATISENFPYTTEEILNTWNDIDYIRTLSNDYKFLDPGVLTNENYKVKLEGYLFPETYYFNENATIDEITRTFLDGFNQIYEKYQDEFDSSEYSIHELVSLASVVQFEAGNAQDMATIAQVFYNRLAQNMRLESSVTVCYALYDDFNDPQDCEVNTDVESPYNTYLNDGLPIGPILNPGEDAIKAVLEPEANDYLFFVADIHGDGTVYYTTNYEDHQKKMEELGLVIE